MKTKRTPKKEIDARMAKLQRKLVAQEIKGTIIVLNSDLFYFTGTV